MTLNFGNALFFFLLLTPLFVGGLGIFCKPTGRKKICLIEAALLFAGAVALGLWGERDIITPVGFMGAPITFSISLTAVYLYIGLLLSLGLLLWINLKKDWAGSLFTFLLVNFSLSSGFLALMSGGFMLRYIALDLVGLFAALSVLDFSKESANVKQFIAVFSLLRLGDLCLLVSILLLNAYTGTLDIAQTIAAGAAMQPPDSIWVFLGFILAILIKLALPPFAIWGRYTRESAEGAAFWIPGYLMPALGFYLLYRIRPILRSDGFFQGFTLILSLVIFSLILITNWKNQGQWPRLFMINGVLACFALAGAAMPGAGNFGLYLFGLILTRLVFDRFEMQEGGGLKTLSFLLPVVINLGFLRMNSSEWPLPFMGTWALLTSLLVYWDWKTRSGGQQRIPEPPPTKPHIRPNLSDGLLIRSAQWVNQKLERDLLSEGYIRLSAFFVALAGWLRQWVEGGLERGWSNLSAFYVALAGWLGQWVEGGFERGWSSLSRGLVRASETTLASLEVKPAKRTDDFVEEALEKMAGYERNVLKKTLRWDLALIPLFLLVIIVLLFII